MGELAHLLLGVHHWHPLENTKRSVAHSHPALLPVREWENWVREARGERPSSSWTHLGIPADIRVVHEGRGSFANGTYLEGEREPCSSHQSIHEGASSKRVWLGTMARRPFGYIYMGRIAMGDWGWGILEGGVSKL